MARVERILVVVLEADESHSTYRRYAVLDDGRRIADPNWRAGSTFGTFFGSAPDLAERRLGLEAGIHKMHERFGARGLPTLVASLADAGIATTAEELLALPVDVAFGEPAEPIGTPPPEPDRGATSGRVAAFRVRPLVWALVIVLVVLAVKTWMRRHRRGR